MNVKIDLSRVVPEKAILSRYNDQIESSLDTLWSNEDIRSEWVKVPMQISKEQIDEIMMTALAAQDSCGLFVVIGNGGDCQGIKGIVEATKDKSKTAPEMEFVGESISSDELGKTVERMKHYEVNVCVISKSGETLETIVAYKYIKQYMENRYGKEIAAKRIMILTGSSESNLKKIARESGSGIFNLSENFVGNFSILSPASLLILAIAGINIERFLSGAEVMATDPFWDIDGGHYAVMRKLLNESGRSTEFISFSKDSFRALSIWIANLFMEAGSKKQNSLLVMPYNKPRDFKSRSEFLRENKDRIIITEIDSENTMDSSEMLDEIVDDAQNRWTAKDIDIIGDDFYKELFKRTSWEGDIRIAIPKSDAFNMGQLAYYFLMTGSIYSYITLENPYDRDLINEIKGSLTYDDIVGE